MSVLETAGRRIRALREIRNLSQKELAERVSGLDQPQLSKLERGKVGSRKLVERIAVHLGVSADTIWPAPRLESSRERTIRIVGKVAAGNWNSAYEFPYDEQETTTLLLPQKYKNLSVYGLEIEGNSVNKVYPHGSIAIVTPIFGFPNAPMDGMMVVVLLTSSDGEFETTIKRYRLDANGAPWLWPESTDPEFQTPIPYRVKKAGEVQIMGVVIAGLALQELPVASTCVYDT